MDLLVIIYFDSTENTELVVPFITNFTSPIFARSVENESLHCVDIASLHRPGYVSRP